MAQLYATNIVGIKCKGVVSQFSLFPDTSHIYPGQAGGLACRSADPGLSNQGQAEAARAGEWSKLALASNTWVLFAVIDCPNPLGGSCWMRAGLLSVTKGGTVLPIRDERTVALGLSSALGNGAAEHPACLFGQPPAYPPKKY